ncbi:hypothetical protein [Glycomyces paridis]|uniref:RDD family protein n=1 Tax=Glycomyces paridis TaxID=2126555 RepID=A0A4S8PHC0_9ACTN|nr:hypothetical protein [Glycomyces paridis]THV30018.1 hypothetical protein E9998_06435 [Glycomyces paridis]
MRPPTPQQTPPPWQPVKLADKAAVILIDLAVVLGLMWCCMSGLIVAMMGAGGDGGGLVVPLMIGLPVLAIVDAAVLGSTGCYVGGAIRRVHLVDVRTGGPIGFFKALLFNLILGTIVVVDLGLSAVSVNRELLTCQITGTRYIKLREDVSLPVGPVDRLKGMPVNVHWGEVIPTQEIGDAILGRHDPQPGQPGAAPPETPPQPPTAR